jgi:hypothetical protein
MPRPKDSKLRLVAVPEVPKSTRRSAYVDLVEEFAASKLKTAKIDGATANGALSAKKAVERLGLKGVSVVTVNGEVYLVKE